jgi:DNA primase
MELSHKEIQYLVAEIESALGAKRDGGGKNLIARCPYCGKEGKYGIYIGRETARKRPFMAHCFSCGASTTSVNQTLEAIGRPDLMVTQTADLTARLDTTVLFLLRAEEEIDDGLDIVELPDFYKRTFSHPYLKGRGFTYDDYDYFAVGTTGKLNRRFNDYVIFPVIDGGDVVGYVARHILSKSEIDAHNRRAKVSGDYRIQRFCNSTENDFVKLLYNYDAVREGETETVILCEGIFDVVALVRKLDLYDNPRIAAVATFGKKISQTQIYKLQTKGVSNIVVGYDGDAVDATKQTASELSRYFEELIADIPNPQQDWEDLTEQEIYDVFAYRLRTPIEYRISKIQQV